MRQNERNLISKNTVPQELKKDLKFDKRKSNFSWKRWTMRRTLRIRSFNRRCPLREEQNKQPVTLRNSMPSIWQIYRKP